MRAPACILLLAASAILGGAAPAAAQGRVERGVRAAPDATIRVYNLTGSTRVRGWDADSVAVVATLGPGAGSFYLGGGMQGIKLGVETPQGAATGTAHLDVRVPRGSVVWVKAADASVDVDGVQGGLDLYSVTGDVVVRGAPSTVRAESMEGRVSVDARTPWARVKTASGPIDLAGGIGDLAVTTVGGAVRVAAAGPARARIESVTGDVVVEGRPARGGSWEIETHSGAVTIALDADAGAEITVHTFGGEIRSDLGRVTTKRQDDFGGRELGIIVGPGGPAMTVRTFKGPVTVRPLR